MKYKRLTKRISDGEEAFLFHSSLHEGIERLTAKDKTLRKQRWRLETQMNGDFVPQNKQED